MNYSVIPVSCLALLINNNIKLYGTRQCGKFFILYSTLHLLFDTGYYHLD